MSLDIIYAFSFITIAPIAIAIFHGIYACWENSTSTVQETPVVKAPPPKLRPEPWSHQDIRRLEKRVDQLEAEARHRPYSPSETIARWTQVSGNATLSDLD